MLQPSLHNYSKQKCFKSSGIIVIDKIRATHLIAIKPNVLASLSLLRAATKCAHYSKHECFKSNRIIVFREIRATPSIAIKPNVLASLRLIRAATMSAQLYQTEVFQVK